MVDQLFHSSEKRLARALLLLANFGSEGSAEQLIAEGSAETPVMISKQEIAAEIAELRREAADARERRILLVVVLAALAAVCVRRLV